MIMLTEHDTLDGGDVVPGWKIPVRELLTKGSCHMTLRLFALDFRLSCLA
jgi:hypothetical protein